MQGADLKLAVFRAIDALDRIGEAGVFDRLTAGRVDESGASTAGLGLSRAVALEIVHFCARSQVKRRLDLMVALENIVVDEASGKTAWDTLVCMPATEDETWRDGCRPANIAWALDDIADQVTRTGNQ